MFQPITNKRIEMHLPAIITVNNVMRRQRVIDLSNTNPYQVNYRNILDLNCSSLGPNTVNMLVCLHSWLPNDIWARNRLCYYCFKL